MHNNGIFFINNNNLSTSVSFTYLFLRTKVKIAKQTVICSSCEFCIDAINSYGSYGKPLVWFATVLGIRAQTDYVQKGKTAVAIATCFPT